MIFKKAIKKVMAMYHVKEMILVTVCRKNLIRLSLYVVFLISAMSIFAIQNKLGEKLQPYQSLRYQTDLKYILFWKPENDIRNIARRRYYPKLAEGQSVFINQKCEHVNCYITYDKHLLKNQQNLDAIVFNVRDITHLKSNEFNLKRSPKQMYIFRSLDSSDLYPVCDKIFDNFFNWTWTYKLNSDIPHPFFNIYDVKNRLIGPRLRVNWTKNMKHNDRFNNIARNKSKAIAWISNCKVKEKYKEFVSELKKEMKGYNYTLDIFGPCGEHKCPVGNVINCHKIIEKDYYYQLVLEDSLAVDYVTEKVGTAMTYVTIPIILGISKYNRFLPPGSYINAQAFDMKKLGAIIDYLIKYPTSYQNFLDWKNHYYYTIRPKRDMCSLCTRLNDNTNVTRRTYDQFRKWWNYNYRDSCRNIKLESMFF